MKNTKEKLLIELKDLLEKKGMYNIDGINSNSNKRVIANAIDCMKCDDEAMMDCLNIVKIIYPNIYQVVTKNETDFKDFLFHSHNRLYVYNLVN